MGWILLTHVSVNVIQVADDLIMKLCHTRGEGEDMSFLNVKGLMGVKATKSEEPSK